VAPNPAIELADEQGRRYRLVGMHSVGGRGAECDIRVEDVLASRRHFLLQRTPAGWEVSDLNSSNGTYLNGRRLQPGEAQPVALSDRITVGRTTLQVRLAPTAASQMPPARAVIPQAVPVPRSAVKREKMPGGQYTAKDVSIPLWQWGAAALAAAGAVLVAIGAFQPWVRVDAQFTLRNLPGGEVLSDVMSAIESLAQQYLNAPSLIKTNSVVIQGMDAYGSVSLLVAGLVIVVLSLDLLLHWRRSVLPGVVCSLLGFVPAFVVAMDAERFARLGNQEILFGVNLLEIVEGAMKLIEPKVILLNGLYLTGFGLVLILVAGLCRMVAPLLFKSSR